MQRNPRPAPAHQHDNDNGRPVMQTAEETKDWLWCRECYCYHAPESHAMIQNAKGQQ